MMNLGGLFRMLGVSVPPETVAQIEVILPQLPAKIQGVIGLVNAAVQNFDQRLERIEANQVMILGQLQHIQEDLNNGRSDSDSDFRPAGAGATQRELERTGNGSGG